MILCGSCGNEVTWGFPQPDDPCLECGEPIGRRLYSRDHAAVPSWDTYPHRDLSERIWEGTGLTEEQKEMARIVVLMLHWDDPWEIEVETGEFVEVRD